MTDTRHSSSSKITSTPDELKQRFSSLLNINPGRVDGNCVLCAMETAKVLLAGTNTAPHNMSPKATQLSENFNLYGEDYAFVQAIINANEIKKSNGEPTIKVPTEISGKEFVTANEFLEYSKQFQPGTIFCIDTECHCFNVFKDFDEKIILIDSAAQIFKQIDEPDDFIVSTTEFTMVEESNDDRNFHDSDSEELDESEDEEELDEFVNIFTERDDNDTTSVYVIGIAHPSWRYHQEKLHLPKNLGLFVPEQSVKTPSHNSQISHENITPPNIGKHRK